MKDVYCRAAFISDIHLGTPGSQVALLLDFLHHLRCDQLYLVGDIIDLEALQRRFWWHPSHSAVLSKFRQMAHDGVKLIYIPGNHDAPLRALAGTEFGDWLSIRQEAVHVTADGRRFRVSHGDEFDDQHLHSDWRLVLGERLHRVICLGHRLLNRSRSWFGLGYRPYTIQIKSKIPGVRRYMQQYAARVEADTVQRGLDGHIGGHIHYGQMGSTSAVSCLNDGDWVEHCTALVERPGGHFELLHWGEQPQPARRRAPSPLESAAG